MFLGFVEKLKISIFLLKEKKIYSYSSVGYPVSCQNSIGYNPNIIIIGM